MFATFATVNASSDDDRNGMDDNRRDERMMSASGLTWNNMNRELMKERMEKAREALKQRQESAKQKRDEMKNRRTGSGMTQSGKTLTTEQLTCVRTALGKREAAVLASFTTTSSAISSSFSTRTTALDAAWSIADRLTRKQAIDTAWKNWNTSSKTARDADKKARDLAWKNYKTEVQTCKVPEALEEPKWAEMQQDWMEHN